MAKRLVFFTAEATNLLTHRLNLVTEAKARGFDVHLICWADKSTRTLQKMGVQVHHLRHMRRGGITPLRDLLLITEVYGLYRQLQPSIVHQVAQKPVLFGTIAARLAGVPAVVNALGGLGYLFISTALKAKIIRQIVKLLWRHVLDYSGQKLILQNPSDFATFAGILSSQHLRLIPGAGINLQEFPHTPEPQNSPIKVMMVSRALWDKGLAEYFHAAQDITARRTDIAFYLAGDIDPQNPQSLTKEGLETALLESGVMGLGQQLDIKTLYQGAHIAVLPSYREGLPKALLEAMAIGRPIVTTDVPGCRDVVKDGANGFVVPVKKWRPLAQAIETLADNPALRQTMGNHGRARAESEFSDHTIVKQTFDIYEALLRPNRGH